ncbi:hypothetical protein EDB19DRAFT_252495 [Suillus lakei]|nr:hypothetical protein EDB19DRAFT_252495 [Suillus lakei]
MHRALLISEVLLEIFTHVNRILRPEPLPTIGQKSLARKSLAALATTCKAFHEPAMDLLWAEVDHLEHLMGCVTRLHPLIYDYTGIRREYNWSLSVEPLSAVEAHQFLRHSPRVRSLDITSIRFVHLLPVFPIETCVFPRLQSLRLACRPPTCEKLNLFLSHTLRRCTLLVVDNYLKSIVTRCAALEHVSLQIYHGGTECELSLLSDSVRLCKRLVSLSCPRLDWAAWKHLSDLPTLRRVKMHELRGAPPWPLKQDTVIFSPFLYVTTLSFKVQSVACIISVIQHSQFPSLKEFKISVGVLSSAEAEQLFCALSNCKACQTLEKINIISSARGPQDPPDNSLTVIPHFLCFTQLRTLQLVFYDSCIYLDDDLLLEAMSAWPHIRTLEIEDSDRRDPSVTFRGLLIALRLCPHLHTLRASIDLVNVNIDPNDEQIQHSSLRNLGFSTVSPIADADALARIISAVFPKVAEVGDFMNESDAFVDPEEWHEVNMHLKSFKNTALLGYDDTGAASNT